MEKKDKRQRKTDIVVKLYVENKHTKLSIYNEGIGLENQDTKKIFDRFYRVNTKGMSNIDGSGVGLSIVKRIVELNHATIKVESEYKKNIEFVITFNEHVKLK